MRTSPPRQNTVSLAGWLFADLLLGMAMFFLVANSSGTRQPLATPTITPTATVTPRPPLPTSPPMPTPYPTPTPFVALSQEPYKISVATSLDVMLTGSSSPGGQRERVRVQSVLKESLSEKCQQVKAGMVLIFGHAADSRQGDRLAAVVSEILQTEEIDQLCRTRNAVLREFHWIDSAAANRGLVDVEVYFFNQ